MQNLFYQKTNLLKNLKKKSNDKYNNYKSLLFDYKLLGWHSLTRINQIIK